MPATANGRRTRRVAPASPAEVVELPPAEVPEVPAALRPRAKSASQLRRVQAATTEPKKRMPRAKAAAEEDAGITCPLAGRKFRLNETIGIMPLMQWAAALDVVDVKSVPQLASFYRLLRAVVHESDWDAFQEHATEAKSSDQDLLDFYSAAIEVMSARPTKEPATS